MAKRVERDIAPRRRRTATVDVFSERVTTWITNKRIADEAKKVLEGDKKAKTEGIRPWVLNEVRRIGQPDEKGSRWHWFTEPVAGLRGVKAQRGTTPTFDTELAEEKLSAIGPEALAACQVTVLELVPDKQDIVLKALQAAGLAEECVQNVTTEIDQDKVWGYHALHKDKLTAEDLNEITPDRETWSLIAIEAE